MIFIFLTVFTVPVIFNKEDLNKCCTISFLKVFLFPYVQMYSFSLNKFIHSFR